MPDHLLKDVFLGRQPILDRQQQLFAYELLFRSGGTDSGNFAQFSDGNQATATVIVNAFTEFSLADALGPYRGFIKIDQGLLSSDLIHALPPTAVVLEILETVAPTEETLDRCKQLCLEGYLLATRLRPESLESINPLQRFVEHLKVDISGIGPERLKQLVPTLKSLHKTLVAEKVETAAQRNLCHEAGFDLFQGYYFARPAIIQGKRLQSSETAVLRLLGLISQDADTAEIEKVFKQEPVLTMNLLRLINSAAAGCPRKITSLRHAITLLGRRQLLRWLQLLLYSGAAGAAGAVNPLLQLAATRGRMMELLVDRTPDVKECGRDLIDQAFMAGILSLMPTLIGVPMSEILPQLPLARPVLDALAERSGILGDLLTLVESLENNDDEKVAAVLERLPDIDTVYANRCLTRALGWANNLAREAS